MIDRRTFGRAFVGLAMAAAFALPAAAEEYTFKLHHQLSDKSNAHRLTLVPWAERVAKLSGGRVKIEVFPAMTLGGKPPELIQQARDGVVDLVWTVNGYTPGLFPRSEVFELPNVHTNNPVATNLALWDMQAELEPEYTGVKIMFLFVHGGQGFHMVDRLARSPADFAGLKLRTPSRTGAWIIEALGASPVAMPVPDLPQALSKKVIDGAIIPWEIIPALKLQDQTKYQIEGAGGTRFGNIVFQVSMNRARWEGLPADIRKAFLDASGRDWWAEVGRQWAGADTASIDIAVRSGNEHVMLTGAETAAIMAALEPVTERWIAEVSAQGIDGRALVAKARDLVARYAAEK
jgi:TRAP-type C4-dicarboxylate transport system substrate-binding protein